MKRLDKYAPFHCLGCILSFYTREEFHSHLKKTHGYKNKDDETIRVRTHAIPLTGTGEREF